MKINYGKRIICFVLIFLIIGSLTGCYSFREKKYYSNRSNYITEEAIVDNIILNEDNNSIYFWLSEVDEAYQDSTFKVEGDSVKELIDNDVFKKITVGTEITYTSAPGYFGDGYCMPIVAISSNGEELLSFETGYKNLLDLY